MQNFNILAIAEQAVRILLARLGAKFHPSIYQWNLPVFPGMANKAQVANTGK